MNIHIGCGYAVGKSWKNYDCTPTSRIEKIPILENANLEIQIFQFFLKLKKRVDFTLMTKILRLLFNAANEK